VQVNFLATAVDDIASVELIAPVGDDSPIRSLLARSGGAYHLCFETNDLDAALIHVQSLGCVIVALPVPAVAFDGRRIAWIYAPTRQLFELVEARPEK
jgi:methylmalonyl-CoA/ethylmalonyl-CoA epimerase